MAYTLREESIMSEWSMMVSQGAGRKIEVLLEIEERLLQAQIPGGCRWRSEEVKSAGLLAKVCREFLIVTLDQFYDHRIYIGIRDYGIHLDCCRFHTVEPWYIKKWVSRKLSGDEKSLSAPQNVLVLQDLRAWVSVVHHAVVDSVSSLVTRLGQDPAIVDRSSKGFLEIW